MTTTLALSFPWGRYHGNPWGRQANEATAEWPPSPWRLLRALYATWLARAPHLGPTVVRPLLEALSALPVFTIPEFAEAHTRHYMPDAEYGRDLKIDAFTVFELGGRVLVRWAVDLKEPQRRALAELASLLPYLGRAESLCEAALIEGEPEAKGILSAPLELAASDVGSGDGGDVVRVLVPRLPLDIDGLAVRSRDVRKAKFIDPPGAY